MKSDRRRNCHEQVARRGRCAHAPRGRCRPLLLGAALAVLALLPAAPAAAHDSLVSVQPAQGQLLQSAPPEVELRFTAELGLAGSTVLVTAPDGLKVSGPTTVQGGSVSAPLTMPSEPTGGLYTIAYRVVSGDGHVVTGSADFTLAGSPSDESAALSAGTAAAEADAGTATTTYVIGGVIVLGAAALLVMLVRRRSG